MAQASGFHDRYGLALGTQSVVAAEAYTEGVDRLISLNAGAEAALRRAIGSDDGFALPHAALAILLRFRGEVAEANASVRQALALAPGLSRREQQHLTIVEALIRGDAPRSLSLGREHLAEFPRDALILSQMAFVIHAAGGDRRLLMLALIEELTPAYGDDWWFVGYSSIFYQDMYQFERARQLASRSLALQPHNPTAAHGMAHVFYETDDHPGGTDFLRGWLPDYDREAPYHSHLSWHLALSELALGRYDQVVAVYEDAIAPAAARTRISFFDAASLLWRFQIYGCAASPLPWREVRDLGLDFFPRSGVPFADAMVALACAGAGDEAALAALMDGLRAQAASGHPIAGSVVLPLVESVAAFGRTDYETAVRKLEPLTDEIAKIGGTNAQREVFEDTLLEAYLRAGRFDSAEMLLRRRLDRRPSTRDLLWLGRAQAGRGQIDEAKQSYEDGRARWSSLSPDSPELRSVRAVISGQSKAVHSP